jgi:hypothetical protein
MESSLKNLQSAEDEIIECLSVATDTVKEMDAAPDCDIEKILALSTRFAELIESVQSRLIPWRNRSGRHDAEEPKQRNEMCNPDNIYMLRQKQEILDTLRALNR